MGIARQRHRGPAVLLAACLGLALVGCGRSPGSDADPTRPAPQDRPASAQPPRNGADDAASKGAGGNGRPRVVALGDSLTAGLGLDRDEAYPAQLQRRVDAERLDYEVVNAGVSGDTTAGGASRLDWALDGNVRILIVALGANDGLRGLSVSDMERNLRRIIESARSKGIQVVLTGMETPGNMGPEYRKGFREVFPRLAKEYRLPFVPFLLEGVAARPEMNQSDGVHPTAEGARRIADNLWPVLRPLLATTAS